MSAPAYPEKATVGEAGVTRPAPLEGADDNPARRPHGTLSYEVSLGPSDLGALLAASPPPSGGDLHGLCYESLYARAAPCVDCPVRRPDDDPWPRVAVWHSDPSDDYRLVRAERTGAEVAQVTASTISPAELAALNEAKIRGLAHRAGLTERERDVLKWLLLGRGLEEIGEVLGIRARTVKFHQQNVLRKLGADSRVDLIRLVS